MIMNKRAKLRRCASRVQFKKYSLEYFSKEKYTLERGSAKSYDTGYSCKLCDFNEYIDSSESADSIVPRNSGGSEKSNDSDYFCKLGDSRISKKSGDFSDFSQSDRSSDYSASGDSGECVDSGESGNSGESDNS